MSAILDKLYQDHRNMSRVLSLVERELALLDGDEPADLPLIYDALHYLTHYGDMYHHVLENRLFAYLQESDRASEDVVQRLYKEHRQLYLKGKIFCDAVREVESEVARAREDFMRLARDYLDMQREHLEFEESVMFPLAQEGMSEADWRALQDASEHGSADPLFGRLVQQEYERLKSAL